MTPPTRRVGSIAATIAALAAAFVAGAAGLWFGIVELRPGGSEIVRWLWAAAYCAVPALVLALARPRLWWALALLASWGCFVWGIIGAMWSALMPAGPLLWLAPLLLPLGASFAAAVAGRSIRRRRALGPPGAPS